MRNDQPFPGECDQALLDAEKIDPSMLPSGDLSFIDFDAWLSQINEVRSEHAWSVEAELADRRTGRPVTVQAVTGPRMVRARTVPPVAK